MIGGARKRVIHQVSFPWGAVGALTAKSRAASTPSIYNLIEIDLAPVGIPLL